MNKNSDMLLTRRAVCAGGASALGVALLGSLLKRTVLIPGLSPEADKSAISIRKNYVRSQMYEGLFFDRFGTALQTPGANPGEAAKLINPLPYRLIGYTSASLGRSGLRQQLYQYLYSNPGPDKHGANVTLTVDDALQNGAYEAVCRGYYGASAVILDADTGEFLCCTSSQFSSEVEYDVNTYYDNNELYKSQDNARNRMDEDPAFTCSTLPGSTSKLLSAACLVRNGVPLTYTDTSGTFAGISNYKHQVLGELDLVTALKKSSNVYFAAGITAAGKDAMMAEMERFGYNMAIPLDNGVVLTPKASCSDIAEARQLSLGQGNLQTCGVWQAMLYSSLCSGNILLPHFIKSISSSTGELLVGEEVPQVVAQPLADENIRETLRSALQACGEKYGLAREGWTVMGKTGTAEVTGWNNTIHVCIVAESPTGKRFAIALTRQNTTSTSSALLEPARKVLDLLIERSALLESEV